MTALRKLWKLWEAVRVFPRLIAIQRAARRAGCQTKEEAMAWAINNDLLVSDGPGRARVRKP